MTYNHSGYLFDSNVVIAILDNDHAAVNLVRQAQEEKRRIFFSTVTECEVLSGIKQTLCHPAKNQSSMERVGQELRRIRRVVHQETARACHQPTVVKRPSKEAVEKRNTVSA
ncbi:PIN domain-containing protein [Paenibacillus eucommiae]|uniref:Nucleic acid-binding protein n=1 Tax=Paenibacillus eucommiae TaxID=1355755 RepID=A0ABS4IZC3_9BACL|nr:PIN domain-containing protein [Paenibacillus eucommiae]MBP1992943.1 putative nucleic acid-binding protein [Paenibacillus eucommiae]